MGRCYRDLSDEELNFILLHSDNPGMHIRKAFASCDGEKIIFISQHRNPEDSNLTIYDVWDVKRSQDGGSFVFESKDEIYGLKALKTYLARFR